MARERGDHAPGRWSRGCSRLPALGAAMLLTVSPAVAEHDPVGLEGELLDAETLLSPHAPSLDPHDGLVVEHPQPDLEGAQPLRIWATHYSIPRAREVPAREARRPGVIPLLDLAGRPLGPALALGDFCRAALAGAIEVATRRGGRRLFRFEGLAPRGEQGADCTALLPRHPAAGRARFRRARSGALETAAGEVLVPFRSIAVDPAFIPLGSVVYIPSARGTVVTMEDGQTRLHDGYFYAADTGGSIDGAHIDVYLGFTVNNPFLFVRSDGADRIEAFIVHELALDESLAELHGARHRGDEGWAASRP